MVIKFLKINYIFVQINGLVSHRKKITFKNVHCTPSKYGVISKCKKKE